MDIKKENGKIKIEMTEDEANTASRHLLDALYAFQVKGCHSTSQSPIDMVKENVIQKKQKKQPSAKPI